MKTIFLVLLIFIIGVFIYFKYQAMGDSQSKFNQTTRFSLGKQGFLRSIFDLHNYGDARVEFLTESDPIAVSWLKPYSLNIDSWVLDNFAAQITKETGRPVNISFGGNLREGDYKLSDFEDEKVKAIVQKPQGTLLYVFFVPDYSPREDDELSTTYEESGIIVSLNSHLKFAGGYGGGMNAYLLSSLLHEFGHQLGLEHNDEDDCIMNPTAGSGYSPNSFLGNHPPQEFCDIEKEQIKQMKLKFQSN